MTEAQKAALAIVLDLAMQNAFTNQEAGGDPDLIAEVARQQHALAIVTEMLEAVQ